jgi:hypothetical protein
MDKKIFLKRGQSVIEYAVLICCICAAFLTMQYYMKRSLMGKMKQTSNDISSDLYDTENMQTNITHVLRAEYESESEIVTLGNDTNGFPIIGITSSTTGTETNIRSGTEEIDDGVIHM